MTNYGYFFGIIGLMIIAYFVVWYIKRRCKKGVTIIDKVTYPKDTEDDRRRRKKTSTTNNDSRRREKNLGIKKIIEGNRRIQIPDDNVETNTESINGKDSNSIELHKPTAL